MSLSPIEEAQGRHIGTVEFVSPDEIKVSLDLDAPDNTAINAGNPRSFPRINNYLLVPGQEGFVVGQVEWLAVERSPFPKRKGLQDFGLVDLPFPQRKLSLNPVGMLVQSGAKSKVPFVFKRGVYAFPTIGDPVLLPTDEQLHSIIESGENRRLLIGHSPLASNAEVKVDPDRLFGRHLAVLGNTGSGKSCTVAGLIRWSLEAAKSITHQEVNARFIILDPNGEYTKAFPDARIFKGDDKARQLKVPLWFWNSIEWCAFTQASSRAQLPLLKRALRSMRNEQFEISENVEIAARRFVGIILQATMIAKNAGEPFKAFPHSKNFTERLSIWATSVGEYDAQITADLNPLFEALQSVVAAHKISRGNFTDYPIYTVAEVDVLLQQMRTAYASAGGSPSDLPPKSEDVPVKFSGKVFIDFLEALAQETGNEQYFEFLLARIRTMLADTRMGAVIGNDDDVTLEGWLKDYIGSSEGTSRITVIDLALIPSEIIHIVTAVIARMVFEALQRYRIFHPDGKTLPTVLVMEEAHTFIRRYRDDSEDQSSAATCCQVFERIAREGRKFGLGLVLSSQRPSELSQTVLSQCNSFLLHRISNDKDQEAVSKLLPDHLRGILRELPVLPTRHAFLLGWASELPILTHVRELPKGQQPQSDDPDFWAVWTGKDSTGSAVERKIDWKALADDWQGKTTVSEGSAPDPTAESAVNPADSAPPEDDVPF